MYQQVPGGLQQVAEPASVGRGLVADLFARSQTCSRRSRRDPDPHKILDSYHCESAATASVGRPLVRAR